VNKYNIFADSLYFEIKIRRQGPKTAGYRRKPVAISNPGHTTSIFASQEERAWERGCVQASWDSLEQKMDSFGRPNSGGKEKLFSIISLSMLINLKRNSLNSHYYYIIV
jgi:hypothetical protein